ncbi:MAG: BamA/TamA family outer membrane protein [Bacteroidales bacterium]|nr:BamA/TamA family outer membrane protein [Bacteroidales bacterium]
MSLRLPKFLVPFIQSENFIRKYTPSTSVQALYNYQHLPVYTRTLANASFGYQWNQDAYRTHMVYPLQLNLVKIPYIEPDYYTNVIEQSSYLINSYKNILIAGGSYSYIYNRQKIRRSRNNWFLRVNAEASGNLLRGIMKITGATPVSDSITSYYKIFDQPFAQYVKADIDARYNRIINDVSSIVFRGFAGAGIPFRNSLAMPFEKQYFEGGANGIRGWQVRSLGPGSYSPPNAKYINQTGDIKLEANVEYRFKLAWILEGAVFVDAGNIWAIREDPDRPGAKFSFTKFQNDIAVGAGFGMRFDLKFVLLRTDLGFKIRDPRLKGSERWIFTRDAQSSQGGNAALVIAIGYPF